MPDSDRKDDWKLTFHPALYQTRWPSYRRKGSSDGTLFVEDENGEDAAVAHFSIIDRNTILISVESSKILFKMYRS